MQAVDITGQKFGLWTVVARAPKRKQGNAIWWCRCECGAENAVSGGELKAGLSKSCGCRRAECNRLKAAKHVTHGLSHTPEYTCWGSMRHRCRNPKSSKYADYGGRGISVCERWNSFENFLADMGRRPTPAHSLDRINNDGNYEPGNCRWATPKEQMNNRRAHRPRRKCNPTQESAGA